MRNINLKLAVILTSALMMGLSIYIMSTPGLPKPLFFTLFGMALIFSISCAVVVKRVQESEARDHSTKVLDIIVSSFELNATLPKYEDIIIDGDKISLKESKFPGMPIKTKVDSFEHHL